ncbi:RNA ligase-domain-containing protein [Neohortaea acidophila]|uniref:tRNA ligase n=1 Tax=Neohortaea acidophila TaxID=245834 RepID=A0A6A6Q676_9PEZI|nr:RNA ligase-domain-containing protein [Neohortaea acidophila]KAF2486907.1 RNA ligase-domain-containing protein [Neohortaea acidophila]
MVKGLENNRNSGKGKGRGGFSCKKSTFDVQGSQLTVDSWKMMDWDYKKANLPTYARGLFTTTNERGQREIAVRGYDKFFNHEEVRETEWRNVENNTRGPYELSVKENGCIIFLAGLKDGTLIVCSKHSTGDRQDSDVSHAKAGEQWIDRQLERIGKTRQDLAKILRDMNATAVAELCDDDFEEHVLAYTPESAGLYLHGINLNLPDFVTYPHDLVNQFAQEWGFRTTTFIIKDTIEDVKTFLEGIADTGAYDGRDTEGFVIRCQSKANTGQWHDWFFKYKFEEPYLMYRQWRECTKAVISGKQPKYRKHKKITEDYILFARKQLHANPQLAKAYLANHGIIKMRDDFLASRGLNGADIIRQEEQDGEDEAVTRDVLLATVATIGCGKTTVALALSNLFNWGHVQNDNITVKKGKPQAFATACVNALSNHSAMIADRNNHQKRERKQLLEDVSKVITNAHFVCLHYVHDRRNYDRIREVTRERVLGRGDNHQTIQAGTKGSEEVVGIMEGFLYRFEPVNQDAQPDDGFDLVIDLDPCVSSRENLETAISRLYVEYPKLFDGQEMPTADDMDAAIAAATNEYTVDIKHEIKGRDDRRGQQGSRGANGAPNGTAKPKEKKLEYFAVQVPAPRINAILEALFRDSTPEQAKMYNTLKHQRRIQGAFHVTLIHRTGATEHANQWAQLTDLHKSKATDVDPEPKLGACGVRLERVVWDNRVMAFVVRLNALEGGEQWNVTNRVAHVTVGTADASIKPVESNALLEKWLDGEGGEGIQEMMVKGNVEVDGTVRGVLQKH